MDIVFRRVAYRYGVGTPFAYRALKDVNLFIPSGTFSAVIGHTGSGKSTLIQHINGLLKPTAGAVTVGDWVLQSGQKMKNIKSLRKKIGMVFQYPEHQLFEETVEKDICFGPINFGASVKQAKEKARASLRLVGLDDRYLTVSPFELSGGQMRRVAIACVLASEPEVLILDEPTVGLDPQGQKEIMAVFQQLHEEQNRTILLVTHRMEDVAAYANHAVVMHQGTVFMEGTPKEIFNYPEKLQSVGLHLPKSIQLIHQLEKEFGVTLPKDRYTVNDLSTLIKHLMKKGRPPA